jgi:insecticidal toxin complex protein TccC
MDAINNIATPELNFPKGGGAIQGFGEALGSVGFMGIASLSIPFPISPARSFTPVCAINYSSGAGNGPFGIGFSLDLPAISRRTAKGVPTYTDSDEFLGLSGAVLIAKKDSLSAKKIGSTTYQVMRFYPRIEASFDRIEQWQSESGESFWLVYQMDGSRHLFGKTAAARICDPQDPKKIFRWLLEESVSLNGEHVVYEYKQEDTEGVDLANSNERMREHKANRYLKRIRYANLEGFNQPYLFSEQKIADIKCLFNLVLDYGEHAVDATQIPEYTEKNKWPVRLDSFSDYAAGFEIRTHRLCRRVLMFHENFTELGAAPVLVTSLEFEYDENPIVTRLIAAYTRSSKVDRGTKQFDQICLAPLEFNYQNFSLDQAKFDQFAPFNDLPGLNSGGFYQLVDLYGEGIPGILYRDGTSYFYRDPQRAEKNSEADRAISYTQWQTLPQLPSSGLGPRQQQALLDITGDGLLDLVLTSPGMTGFFSLNTEKNWQQFVPFSAFPTEFNHPRAYLANIMGAGLSDLILIGPNSVRLYANRRAQGFAPPVEVDYEANGQDQLPSANVNETEVVAFSDILGSGQQHLVRIRYNELVCWPNLGRGEFGKPIQFAPLPFERQRFNARQVFLADIDGSGAADLLYVDSDHIKIFQNLSGNGFAKPYILKFPDSIRYDNLAQVSFADVLGNGNACLVLSILHPKPQHWIVDFTAGKKPYLLEQVNNNRGLNTTFIYRSSAQEWLDAKKENPEQRCYLPFPVHVVSCINNHDEITDNQFQQRFIYRLGYYDGLEREFRGFGYISHMDSETFSGLESDQKINFSVPLLTKVWYHTGASEAIVDRSDYYDGDPQAIALGAPLWLDKQNQVLAVNSLDSATLAELRRALSGRMLRQETYAVDDQEKSKNPYTVQEFRYQVRIQEAKGENTYSSVFPALLEQIAYNYDQVAEDPRCDQQINVNYDPYGTLTESVAINYPRRGELNAEDPYFDEEQFIVRINRSYLKVVHFDQGEVWRLGLPIESRSEMKTFSADILQRGDPSFNYDNLVLSKRLFSMPLGEVISWGHYHYWQPEKKTVLPLGQATPEGLLGQTFVAEIKYDDLKQVLSEAPGVEDSEALEKRLMLEKGGYSAHRSDNEKLPPYYWIPSNRAYYGDIKHFYRIESQRDPFESETQYQYDAYSYAIIAITDALGYKTEASYDYRVLNVWQIKDPNELTQQLLYDVLGRVQATSFRGYENGAEAGFELINSYQPQSVTLAEAIAKPLEVIVQKLANAYFYDGLSWMGKVTEEIFAQVKKTLTGQKVTIAADVDSLQKLVTQGFLTQENNIKAKARWYTNDPSSDENIKKLLAALSAATPRIPCHAAAFVADNYPNAPLVQVRIQLTYSDGLGRVLQVKQLVSPGKSYVANAQAELSVENDKLLEKEVQQRWAVSGRVEYNNKGLPVRKYQPYFIDTYRYIQDASLRQYAFYDSAFYDALGRELKLVNAAGFFQRYTYHPWYLSHEDENDTWAEVLAAEKSTEK